MTQRAPVFAGVPARRRPVELLTWIETLPPGVIAQTPPRPIRDRDIRNPLPKKPNLELLTWIETLPPGRIGDVRPEPIRNRDFPNPTPPKPRSIALRFWANELPPGAVALTIPPNQYDWPNPRGRRGQQPDLLPSPVVFLVTVPNVVGETEAQATTDIQALGLVVSSSTAYSDSVAVGLVISQVPAAGASALPGDTVSIVVSLGPAPQPPQTQTTDQPSGGWRFWVAYEQEIERRKAARRLRKQLEDDADEIEDEVDREIAQLLREQEAKDERRAELERLREIAKAEADEERIRELGERVAKAYERALAQETFSAAEALDRELKRLQEEEEFLIVAAMHILGMH